MRTTTAGLLLMLCATGASAYEGESLAAPRQQTLAQAKAKSAGCVGCHTQSDAASMHESPAVNLGCTDCHGGDASVRLAKGVKPGDEQYQDAIGQAHVEARYPDRWKTSANPADSYALLNQENPEFVRFVNPGDLRVATEACGACHQRIVDAAMRSLMATGAMLWGGAAYNNGILPYKRYFLGEAYTRDGEPAKIENPVKPDANMTKKGVLPVLYPMPSWETTPPGDVFRVFERGGRLLGNLFSETGLFNAGSNIQNFEEPGRPDLKQSNRGPGTGLRISVPVLNVHKTRLNDPLMWFMGTNDNPGDFRSSGCSSCHVVYANDRDPLHSGHYAKFGHGGRTQTADPTIPKGEEGHPLKHSFTRAIPTSQCMVCHMHQPNIFLNSMLGYTMWDYESDAPAMWPKQELHRSAEEIRAINERNPEEAAIRGSWGDRAFLDKVSELNPKLKDTQFADYHGHGWNFRAIYKRDKKGNLLDGSGRQVSDTDPQKFKKAVHLQSIHIEKGMHCVDCHFGGDSHGNGHLYGEVAQAIEIDCVDCHGTADKYPSLLTSGPAAPPGGTDLSVLRTPWGQRRFEWIGGALYQRSNVDPDKRWRVSLVKDSVTPGSGHYNPRSARAKLMSKDTAKQGWGKQVKVENRAHPDDEMLCVTCHSSWTTSCFGCHLPIQANWKTERHHYEGGETRNFATYNPQVVRDDFYMLGRHGEAKGFRISPVRSSSALVLSSTNVNREKIYVQQPPVSGGGYSSQAFAPHYPHTERTVETKTCSDCHLSRDNDNNAWMASLLGLGTQFVSFVGYDAWLGLDGGVAAVQVSEWDEPQAVIGSYLQRFAYPERYAAHEAASGVLENAQEHSSDGGAVKCLQLRGEYLYAAQGDEGLRVYDVASIANKGFSQKIVTGPFSTFGQDTHVSSKDATCVVLPTNQPISPQRNAEHGPAAQEQPMHPLYHYALVTDAKEGLILVDVDTLQNGDPRDNDLDRALTWNDKGVLDGARHLALHGHYAYVAANAGLVVLNLDDPLKPKLETVVKLDEVQASQAQFRYLFALTKQGLQVLDVTRPAKPVVMKDARLALPKAYRLHLARTFAYVAAGSGGLAIVDIQNPLKPRLYQTYHADGRIDDARDVVVGSTNASLFAYVADAQSGLNVIQLTAPDTQPKFYGFSPDPKPVWIAGHRTSHPALALSRGLERDRAVDESGHQIAVFGRIGSRPFTRTEMEKLFLRADGQPWFVSDSARGGEVVKKAP